MGIDTSKRAAKLKWPFSLGSTIFLLALALLCIILGRSCVGGGGGTPRSAAPTATPDPYVTFMTVRNSCGACGTDSPIGGWEAADGRSIILADNGNFVAYFEDGSSSSGKWKLDGDQLCLTPSRLDPICYSYRQRIDAMKLNDAIYIRR